MKLLLIEDNQDLVRRLQDYIGKQFTITAVGEAAEGIGQAESSKYDAIVLDLGLPDRTGEDVCRTIRGNGVSTPLLVLTADDTTSSKVKLLELGADDYLTKPFKLVELQARLKALIRRGEAPGQNSVLAIGGLTIDPSSRRVWRNGTEIQLRRKEFDILEYLMRNSNRIITRPMIVEHVWQDDQHAWHNTVDVHIKHLRDKVDRPFKKPLIKTAYGLGYMLNTN